jgi:hypothetical protein
VSPSGDGGGRRGEERDEEGDEEGDEEEDEEGDGGGTVGGWLGDGGGRRGTGETFRKTSGNLPEIFRKSSGQLLETRRLRAASPALSSLGGYIKQLDLKIARVGGAKLHGEALAYMI